MGDNVKYGFMHIAIVELNKIIIEWKKLKLENKSGRLRI